VIQVIRDLYNRKYGKYGKIKSVVMWLLVITVVLTVGFVFSDQQASSQKNEASSQAMHYAGNGQDNRQDQSKCQAVVESATLVNDYTQSETDKIDVNTQHKSASRAVEGQYSSAMPIYRIDVSIREQKVRIYDEDRLIKEWIVSTGKNNSTPLGSFTTKNKGDWFFSEKYQQGGKWWVAFQGNYLFHSIPMDRDQNVISEEAEKLGMPVSHGCIRLKEEHAKWLYNNIPKGTPVIIYH
jgi:lipoprotein-anchoring transpeptidase ErfK/SrfK